MKARILFGEKYSKNSRAYNVTTEISRQPKRNFCRPIDRETSQKPLEDIGEKGLEIVQGCLNVAGVTDVEITPYCLGVTKGEAFDWEDIHPHVMVLLRLAFGEQCNDIEIIDGDAKACKKSSETEPDAEGTETG